MGRIAGPFGVKGWLKVLPSTSAPDALLSYPQWWVRRRGDGSRWQATRLDTGRTHGNTLIVQLAGFDNRELAAGYAGGEVGVLRDALPRPGADEVYVADLVGLAVVNRQGESLGRVAEVQEFGAHPVLRVVDDSGLTRLVPFVDAYVDAVEVAAGRIEVDWQKDY